MHLNSQIGINNPRTNTPHRPAFTLVELLVVIGIIALLMSILLPTLGRVKEQANKIKCASNLRTFGSVLHLYATQNQNRVPLGYAAQKHAGYMVHQSGRFEVLGTLYETQLLNEGIEAFYCPSKLDPRWNYNTGDNPWPPPPPNSGLTRLGMTVRPCVQFNGMVPTSSTNDRADYRGKFPMLTQVRNKAIAAEMFGEPLNASVGVDPTILPHNKLINVCFDDGSVRAIDSRTPDTLNGNKTIDDKLKELAALKAVPTGSQMNDIYLDETVTPNKGIWAIFDQAK